MENVISMTNGFAEMSMDDILSIDGGAWSWKAFGQATFGGAIGGGITGAFAGSVVLPVVGSVPGWAGGAILGGVGGAATYLFCGWW